jgi:ribokinase
VDAAGENLISVAPGANGKLTPQDVVHASDAIASADALLLQLEVPVPAVKEAVRIARSARVPVILNPAPAQRLPDSLLSGVSILTPNETEAELLTGIAVSDEESAHRAGKQLLGAGISAVLVTRGSKGVLMITGTDAKAIPALVIKPVDTTAAGDAFNGALAVALGEGQELETAVRFASAAGALAATRLGAQPSLPSREELKQFQGADCFTTKSLKAFHKKASH